MRTEQDKFLQQREFGHIQLASIRCACQNWRMVLIPADNAETKHSLTLRLAFAWPIFSINSVFSRAELVKLQGDATPYVCNAWIFVSQWEKI